MAALAPDVTIVRHPIRFAAGVTFDLLLDADLLIDGSDNLATRYLANDAAAVRGIPMVWGSALRWSGQVGVAWDERGVDYRDLFPRSRAPTRDTCEVAGVLPTVCAVIGAMMATEALKLLTGIGEPLIGRVAVYDALTGTTREIEYRRDPDAPRPGSLEERTALREPDAARSVTPEQLAKLLAGPETAGIHETPPVLLDVREPARRVRRAARLGADPARRTAGPASASSTPTPRSSCTATTACGRRARSRCSRRAGSPARGISPAASTPGRSRSTPPCRGTDGGAGAGRRSRDHAARVDALLAPLRDRPAETVPLLDALGRVTAGDRRRRSICRPSATRRWTVSRCAPPTSLGATPRR